MAVLLAANAGFIPTAPLHIANPELSAFRWGIEELNDRMASYGYGGIELHWSNVFKHCRELHGAEPAQAQRMARGIVSAHESWRGTADPMPADPNRTPLRPRIGDSFAVRIGSTLLFPTGADSLDRLETVERKLAGTAGWHYVLFPDQRGDMKADQAKTRRFPNSSIQPTVDVGACWGIDSVGDFVENLIQRGYKATIDTFHISRAGKVVQKRPRWRDLTAKLLEEKIVPEVHVSVGRTDFGHIDEQRYKKSQGELRALVDNGDLGETPLGEIAEMLRQSQWTGNVVIEATIPGLESTFGKMTPKLLEELHGNMTAGVKRLLPHIQWQAPLTTRQLAKHR